MIAVKRKLSNVVTDKTLAVATEATYTLNVNDIRRTYATMLAEDPRQTYGPGVKQVIEEESKWCAHWLNDLKEEMGQSGLVATVTPNIIMEKNSNVEYLDSDEIAIDLFTERFLDRTSLSKNDLKQATSIVASGVSNNFRFYNRPDCRIIVLDYRKLMDCLAFFYGYRELGVSIAYIEAILENCSAAVINKSTELESLIKHCLGGYKCMPNLIEGLVKRTPGQICRDGDMFDLISNLRISTNCFQIIHSTHQVETWQHQKLNLTPKVTYSAVLDTSRAEIFADLIRGMMNEICNNKELANTKILCADYGCVALSVPNTTTEKDLIHLCSAQIRLFNRQFVIEPRLYTYNPLTSYFSEEDN